MICSVDMCRLQTKVRIDDYNYFFRKIIDLPEVSYYEKISIKDYRYNFVIHERIELDNPFQQRDFWENKFWVGYVHNTEKPSRKVFTFVIEFNPNKCNPRVGILYRILNYFFRDVTKVKVKTLDIAFDLFDVSIYNIVVDKNYKQRFVDLVQASGRTIYLGQRGTNGSVKIYDKAKEQGLTDDKKWTRFEVTVKFSDLLVAQVLAGMIEYELNLPDVFFLDENFVCDDVKLRCCIYAVVQRFAKLSDFAQCYRAKIKSHLDSATSVKINNSVKPLITNTIITYFKELYK